MVAELKAPSSRSNNGELPKPIKKFKASNKINQRD
jgi:hypothetical protein